MERARIRFRIVIIGDKGVGRGTILKDLSGSFDKSYLETIGAEFREKQLLIDNERVCLLISNVKYAEEFRFLFPRFVGNSHASILMFDITNMNSFTFLSELPVVIKRYTGAIPILLVGNKVDLEEVREVSGEFGEKFARDNDSIGYIEISAKNQQHCEDLFKLIGGRLYYVYKEKEKVRSGEV